MPRLLLTTTDPSPKLARRKSEYRMGVALAVASKEQLESMLAQRGFAATLQVEFGADSPIAGLAVPSPGAITELVPAAPVPIGAGLTSIAVHTATDCRGRIAWVDPADRFDPCGASRAGLDLGQLLWLRGGEAATALQAVLLVLQAGGFELIVLDLLDQPDASLRLPRAAWFRLLRGLERERRTALLVLAPRPLSGTCADRVYGVRYVGWRWDSSARPLLGSVHIETQLQASRRALPARRPPASVLDATLDINLDGESVA